MLRGIKEVLRADSAKIRASQLLIYVIISSFCKKAFFSNLKMLEKCVESAHKILYVLWNGQAFLSILGKAPSKPTKASSVMWHNGLRA